MSSNLAIPTSKYNVFQEKRSDWKTRNIIITAQLLQKVSFDSLTLSEPPYFTLEELAAQFACPISLIEYHIYETRQLRASPPYFQAKALFLAEPERWWANTFSLESGETVEERVPVTELPEFIYLDVYQFIDTIELGGEKMALMNSLPTPQHTINIHSFMLFDYTQVFLEYLFEGEFPDFGFLDLSPSELIVTREERDRFVSSINGEVPPATSDCQKGVGWLDAISQSELATIGAMVKKLGECDSKFSLKGGSGFEFVDLRRLRQKLMEAAKEKGASLHEPDLIELIQESIEVYQDGLS